MADEVSFLPLGAIIQSFRVGGVNIVQGFPRQEQYVSHNAPYFGETIGRVANRIAGARLASLNGGRAYPLPANDGPHTLHGGPAGWGKRVWRGPRPLGVRARVPGLPPFASGGETVEFALRSEDGDEGFPGEVAVRVLYTVGRVAEEEEEEDGGGEKDKKRREATVLAMEYEAELVGGADETVINMTNHSYFNLSGDPTIEGTTIKLCTTHALPVDAGAIPTGGDPTPFPGLPAPGAPFVLGAAEPDVDHCFVVDPSPSSSPPIDTRGQPLRTLVAASHPRSGVRLEVASTEPAFQFYTGKFIAVPAVEGAPARGARSAFCVEPGRYVNAANEERWKGQVLLRKGERYGARTVYKAWREGVGAE